MNAPEQLFSVLVDLRATPSLTTTGEVRAQFDSRTHNMDLLSLTGGYNWGTQLRTSTTWTQVLHGAAAAIRHRRAPSRATR